MEILSYALTALGGIVFGIFAAYYANTYREDPVPDWPRLEACEDALKQLDPGCDKPYWRQYVFNF